MQKDFWRELFRPENKKTRGNFLLALVLGILLLIMGSSMFPTKEKETAQKEETKAETTAQTQSGREMEQRMAEVLSQIEGAGQVEVMLTFSSGTQNIVAQDEKTEENHSEENGKISESTKQEKTVVLTEDGKGNATPVILTVYTPQVEGVVIVAQGGGNAVVCNALNSAAQALLNVPAHKIAVLKMK